MAIPIVFQCININQLDTNSSFQIGMNSQSNVISTRKQNYGTGTSVGIILITGIFSYIMDSDLLDAPVPSGNITAGSPEAQFL